MVKKKSDDPAVCMLCGCLPLNRTDMHQISACRKNGSGLAVRICDTCLALSIGESIGEVKGSLLRLKGWLEDAYRLANNLPEGYKHVVLKKLDKGEILGCIEFLKKEAKKL